MGKALSFDKTHKHPFKLESGISHDSSSFNFLTQMSTNKVVSIMFLAKKKLNLNEIDL